MIVKNNGLIFRHATSNYKHTNRLSLAISLYFLLFSISLVFITPRYVVCNLQRLIYDRRVSLLMINIGTCRIRPLAYYSMKYPYQDTYNS